VVIPPMRRGPPQWSTSARQPAAAGARTTSPPGGLGPIHASRARRQRAQPLLIEDRPEFGASNFGDQELRVLVTAKMGGTFMRWLSVVKPILRLVYFAPARDTDFPDCNRAPKGRGGVAA
jgi:hypothetical protein